MRRSEPILASLPSGTAGRLWLHTLRVNAPWLVLLALMWPTGLLVEDYGNEYVARITILIGINVILAVSLQLINGIAGQFSLGHAGFMAVGAYMAGYATSTYAPDFAHSPAAANPGAVLLFFLALLIILALVCGIVAGLFLLIRRSGVLHPSLPLGLALLAITWFIADIQVASHHDTAPPYALWSHLILLVPTIFAGLLRGIAQASPVLNAAVPQSLMVPGTFLVALLGGGTIAAVAGLIIGLPTLRLRGDYLAIATLGFAEIIRVAANNSQALGAATGLTVPTYSVPADFAPGVAPHRIFPWVYGAVLLTILMIARLARSAKGRALEAVREDEVAAAAVGIDTTHHKVLAFVFGAFFAGIAGALFAHYDGYLNPNSFGFMRSVELVVIVTLGGLGSISGAVLAAIVLTWLPEFLRDPALWLSLALRPLGVQEVVLPDWLAARAADVAENRLVLYAVLLILMMLLRPRGLLGGIEFRRRQPVSAVPLASTGSAT